MLEALYSFEAMACAIPLAFLPLPALAKRQISNYGLTIKCVIVGEEFPCIILGKSLHHLALLNCVVLPLSRTGDVQSDMHPAITPPLA
jgi:hypothetical protein